jgi:hypothetical protein
MRKIAGILGILVALSILVMPMHAFAATSALAQDCKYDTVKWEDNPDSCKLYLNNWGKTPMTAMSRLAGLTLPINKGAVAGCNGTCASCNDETGNLGACTDPKNCKDLKECPSVAVCGLPTSTPTACNAAAMYGQAHCCCQWGISTAFANKSWAGNSNNPKTAIDPDHPLFRGNSDRRSPAGGGDWGITGCAHSECKADIWCLSCNIDPNSACRAKK